MSASLLNRVLSLPALEYLAEYPRKTLLKALKRIGWSEAGQVWIALLKLSRPGYTNYIWAFHDGEEIGPRCWLAERNIRFRTGRSLAATTQL